MRFNEFSNPADQLELIKLIFDNTWAAIANQPKRRLAPQLPKKPIANKRPATPKIPSPPRPKLTPMSTASAPKATLPTKTWKPQQFNTPISSKPAAKTPRVKTPNGPFDALSAKNELPKKSIDRTDDRYSSNGDTNLKKLLRIFQQVST